MNKIRKLNLDEQEVKPALPKKVEVENNYYHISDIPSKYMLYDKNVVLTGRPMNVLEVKKLASMNEENSSSVIEDILSRCIKGIDIKDLLVFDKYFLLFWLRANTYKESGYKIQFECTHCEKESTYNFSIESLDVKYIDENYFMLIEDTLPMSKSYIKLKSKTCFDELKQREFIKQFSNKNIDLEILDICTVIEKIGDTDKSLWEKYNYVVNELHPYDFSKIIQMIDKISFGVSGDLNVICNLCKEGSQCGVSFQPDFFIPTI